ncbi:MAG: hypothetical protein NXI24_23300 [bacterium]|nr:hypothetical protein [bacterium]
MLPMSREFDPENPSNPYASESSGNPYAATRHSSSSPKSNGLFGDLTHQIRESEFQLEDILRVSVALYRRYAKELGGAALVFAVALGVLNYAAFQQIMEWLIIETLRDPETRPDIDLLMKIIEPRAPTLMALSAATLVTQALLMLYTVLRTNERCTKLDRAEDASSTLQTALGKLPRYTGLLFVAYFAVLAGLLLCVVPGIVLAIHFSLLAAIVAIGGKGFDAFPRAFAILKGRVFRTASVIIVTYVAIHIVPLLISSVYAAYIPQLIDEAVAANPGLSEEEIARALLESPTYYLLTQLPGTIAGALLTSFLGVATTVMYLNFTRDEAQDRELTATRD